MIINNCGFDGTVHVVDVESPTVYLTETDIISFSSEYGLISNIGPLDCDIIELTLGNFRIYEKFA